jgi:hypothetical protein
MLAVFILIAIFAGHNLYTQNTAKTDELPYQTNRI